MCSCNLPFNIQLKIQKLIFKTIVIMSFYTVYINFNQGQTLASKGQCCKTFLGRNLRIFVIS
jgi:hypothetical protein